MKTVEKLCSHGVFVVVTLSPFGPWGDLRGTLRIFKDWGVPYVTVLFFKRENHCAPTPPGFLNYLSCYWPDLLDPAWQANKQREIQDVYGVDRVLMEKTGFSSLVAPHHVAKAAGHDSFSM